MRNKLAKDVVSQGTKKMKTNETDNNVMPMADRQTERAGRQADRQTGRQPDRQTDRQTGRQAG